MDVKKRAFAEALASFSILMAYDRQALAGTLDANLMDAVENGMAQKFEYTLEQCWKAVKAYLKEMEGLDEASPKKTVKAFYLNGHLSEEDYGIVDAGQR